VTVDPARTRFSLRPTRGRVALPSALVGILAAPYFTIHFDHRASLRMQAGVILGIVMALLVGASVRRRREGPRTSRPSGAGWGAQSVASLVYFAGALFGAVVGIASGNAPEAVAGQALSMALLPLAWLAGTRSAAEGQSTVLYAALVGAVGVASAVHWLHWFAVGATGIWVERLAFGNSVSPSGAAPLAATLAAAFGTAKHHSVRRAAVVCLFAILLFALGSGGRGAWVAISLGLGGVVVTVDRPARWRLLRGVIPPATFLLLSLLLGGLWTERRLDNMRPERLGADSLRDDAPRAGLTILPSSSPHGGVVATWSRTPSKRQWLLTRPMTVSDPGTYRLVGAIRGTGAGEARLGLRWLDGSGTVLRSDWTPSVRATAWRPIDMSAATPARAAAVEISIWSSDDSTGTWQLRDPGLSRVGPRILAPWVNHVQATGRRLRGALGSGSAEDPSLAYRRREARSLSEHLSQSTWWRRVSGHGLGATFNLTHDRGDTSPSSRPTSDVHYIHNFYLFLLFKLGLVGSTLVLAALGLWGLSVAILARSASPGLDKRLSLALLAAWLAYCVWSISSPEILDFRIAPLWGLLFGSLRRHSGQRRMPARDAPALTAVDEDRFFLTPGA